MSTQQRLDMSVTGPAVNEVTRYETLKKALKSPIVTSAEFMDCYRGQLQSFGPQDLKGFSAPTEVLGVFEKSPV
ncbi:MAG: hypothetical protein ABJN26_15510 [Stappiaceae bacterium]